MRSSPSDWTELALDIAGLSVKYVTSNAEDDGIEAVGLAAAEVVGGIGRKVKDGSLTGDELAGILKDAIAPLRAWRRCAGRRRR